MIPLMMTAARGQVNYSNVVMSLNPVAYWPLQETTPAPRYDVETNYGSFGPIANAYYASTNAAVENQGAIAGDSDGSRNFLGNSSSFAVVPTTDNRVSMRPGQPFTVEAWARATGNNSYVAIVNQTGRNGSGGINAANASSGWMLCQNYSASWTAYNLVNGNHPPAWSFHVFNGISDSGGAEAEIPNTNCLTGAGGYVNSWVYLVGVFDGTNAWLYVYSTNLNNAVYGGTNAMNLQLPITTGEPTAAGVPGPTVPGAQFTPDTWDPIQFAGNRGLGANPYHGWIDEVAIYTNALTSTQITNHWAAAVSGAGNYNSTVLADQPVMYWRMDAPKWTRPAPSTYPTAAVYGSAASTMTNFNTGGSGANCAVYQPGTVPGVSGPSYAGFGSLTNACAFNGLVGEVDAGYSRMFNPTDVTNNYTLVAWFRGNPMDANGRYNCLASHSDSSWKAQFNNGTTYGSKGAGSQPTISPATYQANDGKWHMYTLESTYTNGVSTNVTIYLDDGIHWSILVNTSFIPGSTTYDAAIGGAPDSNYNQPTNESSYISAQQFFAGEVAHVAYFNNALTLGQIQSLFYNGDPAPTVVQQPAPGQPGLNNAYTNTVVVGGIAPFYYQWYNNNGAIAGATSSNLVINPVVTTDNGNYYVVITNVYGAVTSSVANVTVYSNITFTAQLPITYTNTMTLYGGGTVGGTNYLGSSPTFTLNALGTLPISYQWRTNGVAVGGATGTTFTITDCQMGGPTNIECVLANSFGSVTSEVWSVNYLPAPMASFPQSVLAAQPIGYWRLDDGPDNSLGNEGAICTEYQGGNNGIYTNVYLADQSVLGGTGYDPITDPNEYSALFGVYAVSGSFAGTIGTNIDFSVPMGGNGEFTVAIWANGNSQKQAGNGGIVTKGYFNGEEVNIDNGGPSIGGDPTLRLEVRDANAGDHDANSTIDMRQDSLWHYIVGVCDEANGKISLYFDGSLVGSASMPVAGGIMNSASIPLMIGARSSNASSNPQGNNQFSGFLNDLAIYNYAFTPQQVVAQYNGADIPPYFPHEPIANTNLDAGATLTVTVPAGGSMPLSYQWSDGNGALPGQTNATLVVSNDASSDNYTLTVTNLSGSATSSSISVNVVSGAPQIFANVQNPFYAILGQSATNSALVYGSLPLGYQWQFSANGSTWVNIATNSQISGAQTNALTISSVQAANVGDYQLVITNSSGSVTSSVAPLVVSGVLPLSFFNNTGLDWKTGAGATFANGVLTLTYGTQGNGTYFFNIPQYVGAFQASFTYNAQYDSTYPLADGITFCLQDDPRGASATGSGGGELGFTGISPSVGFQINIYPGNGLGGTGYGFGINGTIGNTTPPGNVNLTNGPVDVSLNYANGNLGLTFSNEVGSATFSTNMVIGDIAGDLGSETAYVGFTGAFGGDTAIQTIQNFQFVSIPPQAIAPAAGAKAMIAWPNSVVGYTLQKNSNLLTTNWVTVTNAVVSTNGVYMATVPVTGTNQFFRLVLPLSQNH